LILGVNLLVIVLAIAGSLWHSHSVAEAGEAWGSLGVPVFQPVLALDQTVGLMDRTVQTYSREPAAQWAEVFAGDTFLMVGTNKMLTNKTGNEYQTEKKIAVENLKQARDRYGKALETLTIPGAREQAMFGKARAIESLIQSETKVDDAILAYEELAKSFPEGIFKALAQQRIEQLKKPEAFKFYQELARYTPQPKPELPHSPLDKLGPLELPEAPTTPTMPGKLSGDTLKPDLPKPEGPKGDNLKPEAPKPAVPAGDAPKPDAPKTEPPKAATPKPDAPKPDAPKPVASQPVAPQAVTPKKDK